ncbi:hypothetical protein [uncultured Lacinutrix sp.]|uniref:hypothetical protein n=1 Tax=uncultured Lacinutrix sp. TaxID=574032 RepID=UPI0026108BAF|nr:hypothetical protein [uncultured Lacinutrix sp.]
MSDFTRTQFRQVRIARNRAVRACRIGHFRFHSYMNLNASQHRRIIENALYNTFLYTVRANRDNIDIKQTYERECGIIFRNLHRLRLASPRYQVQQFERDVDGHDIVYDNSNNGLCGSRFRPNVAHAYPMSYLINDNEHIPPGMDTNIHICPSFFDYNTESRQMRTIIHELCHTVLGFGYLDTDRDVYRDNFDLRPYNNLSIAASLRTPDKYSNFTLAISGLFRR